VSAPVARMDKFLQFNYTLKWFMKNGFENCQICGVNDNLTFDHIVPRSWGGSNEMDNLCILCKKCNGTKGNRYYFNLQPLSFLKPKIPAVCVSELEAGMHTVHGYIEEIGFVGSFDGKAMYSIEFSGENLLLEVMDGRGCRNHGIRRKAFVSWPGDFDVALDPRFCLV
jgi:hypothetical protein